MRLARYASEICMSLSNHASTGRVMQTWKHLPRYMQLTRAASNGSTVKAIGNMQIDETVFLFLLEWWKKELNVRVFFILCGFCATLLWLLCSFRAVFLCLFSTRSLSFGSFSHSHSELPVSRSGRWNGCRVSLQISYQRGRRTSCRVN